MYIYTRYINTVHVYIYIYLRRSNIYIYNIHMQIHVQYYILPISVQTNITYPEVPCPESWGSCFLFDKVSPKEQKNDAMNPRAWLIEYQTYRPAHADNMRVRALYSLKGRSRVLAITPMPIGTMLGCCCKLSIHLKGSQTHPEIGSSFLLLCFEVDDGGCVPRVGRNFWQLFSRQNM